MRETSEERRRADPGAALSIDRRRALAVLGGASLAASYRFARAADLPTIRIAILQYGSVAWQMETIRRRDLAAAEGIAIAAVPRAPSQAALGALQPVRRAAALPPLLWGSRERARAATRAVAPRAG